MSFREDDDEFATLVDFIDTSNNPKSIYSKKTKEKAPKQKISEKHLYQGGGGFDFYDVTNDYTKIPKKKDTDVSYLDQGGGGFDFGVPSNDPINLPKKEDKVFSYADQGGNGIDYFGDISIEPIASDLEKEAAMRKEKEETMRKVESASRAVIANHLQELAFQNNVKMENTLAKKRMRVLEKLSFENDEKLDIKESYTIDKWRLHQWIYAQPTPTLQKVAEIVSESIQHISYDEFVKTLNEMMTQILVEYIHGIELKTGAIPIPLLVFPKKSDVTKSYLWVSMLANMRIRYPIFRWINGIVFNMEEVIEVYKSLDKSSGQRYAIALIFLDDAVYSGQQMTETATEFIDASFDFDGNYPTYIIATSYITEIGKNRINSGISAVLSVKGNAQSEVIFPTTTKPMKEIDTGEIRRYYGAEDTTDFERSVIAKYFGSGVLYVPTASYFDHKMPDSISTITRILLYGEVWRPNDTETPFEEINFIKGCFGGSFETEKTKNQTLRAGLNSYSDVALCPVSFYKTVKWTYNGKEITSQWLSRFFDRHLDATGKRQKKLEASMRRLAMKMLEA